MDRNSIFGIVLIFAILVVFSIINKPSKEQIEAAKRRQDSIALVEAQRALQPQLDQLKTDSAVETADQLPDSIATGNRIQEKIDQFGVFGNAAIGTEEFYTLENNLMIITLSNKGGKDIFG
jgi:YidC/Oxa1 family membrane protein insertase